MSNEMFIGIIASLVASIMWWTLSQLYSWDTRKRIAIQIIRLRDDNFSFQKYLDYSDYNLAIAQAQRMLEEIGEIQSLIMPLTYTPEKRKLINTLLNNLYIIISRFQRCYRGHDRDTEKEVCCQRALRALYLEENPNGIHSQSSISDITIELLSHLNYEKWLSVRDTIRNVIPTQNTSDNKQYLFLKDIIGCNNFANNTLKSVSRQYDITNDIMTREEYFKLIDSL